MSFPIYHTNNESKLLRWFVFYTKPRAEKKAYDSLLHRQYDVYLAEVNCWKMWNNRQRKLISTPLFPGYIFVRSSPKEIAKILMEDRIVCCIKLDNKPVCIKEEEISIINEMTSKYSDIAVNPVVQIGQKVRVTAGSLVGHEGIVANIKGKYRFGINVSALNQFASVEVDFRDIEYIE